jgi:hypothetical protein
MCDHNTEDPAHSAPLPTPAKRPPNQHGEEPRIRLAGGPFVDKATLGELHGMQQRGVSYGVAIDRLVTFAKKMGFDPVDEKFIATTDLTAYPRAYTAPMKRITPSAPKRRQG